MKPAQVVLASVLAGALLVGFPMKGPALPAVERVDRSSAPLLAGVDRAWWATIRSSIQSVNRFGWKVVGDQRNALFGWSVGTAGDVNGDGYDDAIVGAYQYSNGQTDEGRAFVYYGSASGLSLTANWTAEGDQANAYFGTSVGTAGDVNGDGFDDVIVGAPDYTIGQTGEGRAYVYLGGADGLSLTPVWTAEGDQTYGHFGGSVGTAGDVNGDGFDDIIVGSPYYDNGMVPDVGRADVYDGSASGPSLTPNWTAQGDQAAASFGFSARTAGDVNRDGFDDIIVGAFGYSNGQTGEGRAYVYLGGAAGLSLTPDWTAEGDQMGADFGWSVGTAGDVNGDGFDDVVVGAFSYNNERADEGRAFAYFGSPGGLSLTPSWTAERNQGHAWFGYSVGTAGDVNGDGFDDVIVGAPYYDNGQTDEGEAFIFHGSADGLSSAPHGTAQSDQAGSNFGWSVGTAGDVNGDGYDDVIVGAIGYDHGRGGAFAR